MDEGEQDPTGVGAEGEVPEAGPPRRPGPDDEGNEQDGVQSAGGEPGADAGMVAETAPDGGGSEHGDVGDGDSGDDDGDSDDGDGERGSESVEPAEVRSPRRRPVLKGLVRSAVAVLSVAALGVTGYAYTTLEQLQDNVNTTDALRLGEDHEHNADTPPPPENDGATDILLVGADSRTDMEGAPLPEHVLRQLRTEDKAGVSTDTLIVLRVPHDGTAPTAISIPRDSWVPGPDGGQVKINSVYGTAKQRADRRLTADGVTDPAERERESNQEGRTTLARTVQNFLQVRVDHYAEVNLFGFYLLTEALGGVEVCLNQATSDPDSGANFAAGPQKVSGGEALSFVRQRKNLPGGDLGRIQRQQAFLASALGEVLSAGTLTDPGKLERLADTLRRSLVLDEDLNLLTFAAQTRGIASGEVSFTTIPVVDINARSEDGTQSIVRVDIDEVREFVADAVEQKRPSQSSGGGSAPQNRDEEITTDGVVCVN